MQILIAEDDKILAEAYKMKFTRLGYDVIIAYDGVQTLEALKKNIPDLLILDLVMPIKDGFETLQQIRSEDKYSRLQVVVASNLSELRDIRRAFVLGANDYFVKTDISLEELTQKVKDFLESGKPLRDVSQDVKIGIPA